jgi:glycerophosphoryl diester phosphodiesterase
VTVRRLIVPTLVTALLTVTAVASGPGSPASAAASATSCVPPPAAHRGASASAPENTLPAFAKALRAGARILEMDVRFTADGQPVLMHDATVDRTTNGTGPVAALTLAQVKGLDAGRWFGKRFRHTRVPTLREVLRLGRPYGARYLVELKVTPPTPQLRYFLGRINGARVRDRVTVTSFHRGTLAAMHAAQPSQPTALIDNGSASSAQDVLAQGRSYLPNFATMTPDSVTHWEQAGIAVIPWVVGTQAKWRQAAADRAAAVITNRPAAYLRWATRVCR